MDSGSMSINCRFIGFAKSDGRLIRGASILWEVKCFWRFFEGDIVMGLEIQEMVS